MTAVWWHRPQGGIATPRSGNHARDSCGRHHWQAILLIQPAHEPEQQTVLVCSAARYNISNDRLDLERTHDFTT